MTRVLVTGAGGFIGHHLVSYLKDRGYWVRGVDIKEPEYESTRADEFELLDLRRWGNCLQATRGIDEVYNLAANMGGIGFIEHNKAVIMVASEDEMLKSVAAIPGAVGLVDVYSITEHVKVVRVDGKLPLEQGYPIKGR